MIHQAIQVMEVSVVEAGETLHRNDDDAFPDWAINIIHCASYMWISLLMNHVIPTTAHCPLDASGTFHMLACIPFEANLPEIWAK
jgi:hypothetical protein